jgi:hypothetical protein
VDRLTRVAPSVDHTNSVAALSQDKLNFIPATVDRARGGRLAMTSGFLTQTISAVVQSSRTLLGGALETCSISLTWPLEMGSLMIRLDVSSGTLLAQTGAETYGIVSVVFHTALATPKRTISIASMTKSI